MLTLVPDAVEAYAAAHTTPPTAAMANVVTETEAMGGISQMMTGPVEGRFLETLVFVSGARTVLELGTFTGYSSISMASALPPGGVVITCDVNPDAHATARRHAEAAGVVDRIDYRLGPALDTIAGLDVELDLVFIDADKTNYLNYYEAVVPKLSARGLIVVDNTLWSGAVVDLAADADADTTAIAAFNDRVVADERVVCVQLTIRDGVTLIRLR